MDNYFHDTIALPYTETIEIGSNAKYVRKESKEEMLAFLRSEESLVAYSNSQELLAVATLFNININIVQLGPASVFSPCLGPKQNTIFTVLSTNHPPPTTNFLEVSRHSREPRFVM